MQEKDHATVMYPPRYIKEIDLMMITAFASNQRRRGPITQRSSFESSTSSTGSYAPVITYNLGTFFNCNIIDTTIYTASKAFSRHCIANS
jgi:hypothetical protein